jgi:hypothetical protein
MSYKDEVELVRQGLIDMFIKDLEEIRKLALSCSNKEELINKMKNNGLYESHGYYYIKDMDFENIIPKLNLLLEESED